MRLRDAALSITTSGWFEVELFEPYETPHGSLVMAHVFREHVEHVEVAAKIVRDWLGELEVVR